MIAQARQQEANGGVGVASASCALHQAIGLRTHRDTVDPVADQRLALDDEEHNTEKDCGDEEGPVGGEPEHDGREQGRCDPTQPAANSHSFRATSASISTYVRGSSATDFGGLSSASVTVSRCSLSSMRSVRERGSPSSCSPSSIGRRKGGPACSCSASSRSCFAAAS